MDKWDEQAREIVEWASVEIPIEGACSNEIEEALFNKIASALRTQAEEYEKLNANYRTNLIDSIKHQKLALEDCQQDSGLAHHAIRLAFGITEKCGKDGKYLPLSYLVTEAVKKYEAQGKLLEEAMCLLEPLSEISDIEVGYRGALVCLSKEAEEAKKFLAKLEEK